MQSTVALVWREVIEIPGIFLPQSPRLRKLHTSLLRHHIGGVESGLQLVHFAPIATRVQRWRAEGVKVRVEYGDSEMIAGGLIEDVIGNAACSNLAARLRNVTN